MDKTREPSPDVLAQWTVLSSQCLPEIVRFDWGRSDPGVDGAWDPDPSLIADIAPALRLVLQPLLADHNRRVARWFPSWPAFDADDYFVQCVGMFRNTRRLVYLMGCRPDVAMGEPRNWRFRPMFGCDGGPTFFRAEYDVNAQRIVALRFNGPYSATNPQVGWTWSE